MINVDDIKQYFYCKRIPFYNHIFSSDLDKPYLVESGNKFEQRIDLNFIRSTLYKRESTSFKLIRMKIISNNLNLIGSPDLIAYNKENYIPIEIKYSYSIQKNAYYQLIAYSILLESRFNVNVNIGYIFYGRIQLLKFKRFNLRYKDKILVNKIITELNTKILNYERPAPTQDFNKCCYCEYRNLCNDVV